MNPKLSVPVGSQFNLEDAIELLTLTQEAQAIHARFKQGRQDDWEKIESIHLADYGDYEVLENLGRAQFSWGFRKRVPFGFIVRKAKRIYVIFRGTATRAEWISNLRAFQTDYMPLDGVGEVHKGFHAVYNRADLGQWWEVWFGQRLNFNKRNDLPALAERVEAVLNAIEVTEETECFVSGHSLGGALATLAALHISQKTPFTQPILYAIANPRAGDAEFVSHFSHISAYRIFNSEDLVPGLPLPTLNILGRAPAKTEVEENYRILRVPQQGYKHVGEAIAFTDSRGTVSANHIIPTYLEFLIGCR